MGYRRGTTIYRCLPFSYVVSESVKSLVCDFCLRSQIDENILPNNETMKRCSGCKTVYYCQGKLSTIQHKYIFVKLISRKIIITYLNTYFIFLASCQKNAWLTYHREECMYLRKVAPKIPVLHWWWFLITEVMNHSAFPSRNNWPKERRRCAAAVD